MKDSREENEKLTQRMQKIKNDKYDTNIKLEK